MDLAVKKPPFISRGPSAVYFDIATALLPIVFWAVFIFSWRALALIIFGIVSSVLTDAAFGSFLYKRPHADILSSAVTGTLTALAVSVDAPVWTVIVAGAAAILVAKYSLGLFSKRAYVFAPAPFGMLSASLLAGETETFIEFFREGEMPSERIIDIFIGNIYGALGKVSVLLVLAAAVYLIIKRAVSLRVFLSALTVFAVLSVAFYPEWTTYTDNLIYQTLCGGFLFCLVFGACDRSGAPLSESAKIIYGALFAVASFFLRCYTGVTQPELVAAVFLNLLSPVLDNIFKGVPFGGKRKVDKI